MLIALGKPRPAVVVQTDLLMTPIDVLLCPLTTHLVDAPLYRPSVEPDARNGLATASQAMVDKVGPARREAIDAVVGRLDQETLGRIDNALMIVFDLATG